MAPDTSRQNAPLPTSSPMELLRKWNVLFDADAKEWMAFKPTVGLQAYACYFCSDVFYSRKSFLDHINRRIVILRYRCPGCDGNCATFYNRCALLMHAREHFDSDKGVLNLANLEVDKLPFGLAGFVRHPDYPYLYDVEERPVLGNQTPNTQFYAPDPNDKGKETIKLIGKPLIVISRGNSASESEPQSLTLKQIAENIPKCRFVALESIESERQPPISCATTVDRAETTPSPATVPQIKSEPEDDISDSIRESLSSPERSPGPPPAAVSATSESPPAVASSMVLPVITKIETVEESGAAVTTARTAQADARTQECSECHNRFVDKLTIHFLGNNRPKDEKYRCTTCRLICPTICSFKAHCRIHTKEGPHVCPDCGELFADFPKLNQHMDEVCFHMTKSVRFRCPGRRCGKIFASDTTFGPHFKQFHIHLIYVCGICKFSCNLLDEIEEHCDTHEEHDTRKPSIIKLYACPTCVKDNMNWHQLKKHMDFHCKDLTRCIYIYMCKFCKCYFRSIQTMATHLQNCKVQKTGVPRRIRSTNPQSVHSKYTTSECKSCKSKFVCFRQKPMVYCNQCAISSTTKTTTKTSTSSTTPTQTPNVATAIVAKKVPSTSNEKCVCILCKLQIDFDQRRQHQRECKYSRPQVYVERLEADKYESYNHSRCSSSSCPTSGTSNDEGSPQKHRSSDAEAGGETRPRKRLRTKPRKPQADLTAEGPMQFDGTYQCKLCDYSVIERESFHEHVKTHRTIATAYQCMECGECFVVKPSLVKHMMHFHNIANEEEYFARNDCFDQNAVDALAKVVKAPYLANGDAKENQCRVCLEQFDSAEAHDKHFRTHGMAFLMKNSI